MRALAAMLLIAMTCGRAMAQDVAQQPGGDLSLGQVRSPILTVDADRLYAESLYGQRITAEVRRDAEALDIENQRIEAALTEEERSLTELRPTMSVEAFRIEADAFDAKVQDIRQAQDAKERSLQQAVGQGQTAFLDVATPILAQIMIDSGAAVILDRRSVFLGVDIVDITDRAIVAIDAAIGDGSNLAVDPAPDPEADPAIPPMEPPQLAPVENP